MTEKIGIQEKETAQEEKLSPLENQKIEETDTTPVTPAIIERIEGCKRKKEEVTVGLLNYGIALLSDGIDNHILNNLSDAEVIDEASRLAKPDQLSIQELRRSSQIAARVDGLAAKAKQQGDNISERKYRLMLERRDLQQELSQKEQAKGLRRLAGTFSRSSISKKVLDMDESIKELETQEEAYFDQAQSYEKKRSELTANYEQVLLGAISSELQGIRGSYEGLLESILEDGQMLSEIRESYMADNFVPKLDGLVEKGQIKAEDRDNLLSQLRTTLAERDKSKERDTTVPQELRESCSGFYFEVEQEVENLLQGYDRFIIQRFVSQLAYDDLTELRENVVGLRGGYDWQRNVNAAFEKVLKPARSVTEEEGSLLGAIQPATAETISYRTMAMFDVARDSNVARAVFGETIERIDNQIYSTTMDKALSDRKGGHIDMLAYYPTPEAIRNLVIIAAADSQNYRTVHANWAFRSLAKRKGWSEAVDQAAAKYPELKKVGNILEDWTHSEYWNHPEVKEVASDLALSLISSDQEIDQRLVQLSIEALPNEDVLSILVKDGVLSADSVLSVRNGVELLRRYSETPEEREARIAKQFDSSLYNFQSKVRETALAIRKASENDEQAKLPELMARFNRLGRVAEEWQKYSEDFEMLGYLSTYDFLDIAEDTSDEGLSLLFKATEYCPALTTKGDIFLGFLKEHAEEFLNEEGLRFFHRISKAYSDYPDHKIKTILGLVPSAKISRDRVEELPVNASDLLEDEHFSLVTQFSELYLASSGGSEYYRKMSQAYPEQDSLREFSFAVGQHNMPKEVALAFSGLAPLLMDSDAKATRSFVLQNAQAIATNAEDVQFLNGFVGAHGRAADQLVRDYTACVRAGSVDESSRPLILDFTKEFRVLSPVLFDGYKEAAKSGTTEMYLSGLKSMAERMTSTTPLTDKERELPYYKDLIRAVYQNNSGKWTSYENNETCIDRSDDLSGFKVRSRYDIDLMSAAEVKLREGEELSQSSVDALKNQILILYQEMGEYGYDLDKTREDLNGEIDEALVSVKEAGGLSGINIGDAQTIEEKIFLLLVDNTYGLNTNDEEAVKRLLIKYEFAYFDDIRQYVEGTSDRVSKANNQDYALLCELHSFFSDRIKELNRSLVRAGWDNSAISQAMPQYFSQLAEDLSLAKQQDQINRLRIDRLGLSDGFIQQVGRTLKGKTGREYKPEQVRRLIRLYEGITGGLQEKTTQSPKKRTKAFYGQLKAQRGKTIQAMEAITGETVDPVDIHLGNVDLSELLAQQRELETAQYNDEQFANYTAQRFLDFFSDERNTIERELEKFESSSGKKREVVHGYITKTKESAHARMVGGVCVSGDNPGKSGERCQWNMPNYLQLVLQDPETLRCQGVALLHHFTDEQGRKVLSASLNPSSTYLYSVDEVGLFDGMMGAIEQFATDNEFDLILTSKNKSIRTNRTGGEFERAIDRRVGQVNESFVFNEPKQFSHSPSYSIDSMDVVWKRS